MLPRPSVSVVVPVYNAARHLTSLVERLEPVLSGCASSYELLLVNDGSRDESWETIRSLAARFPWIRGVNLMRNYGQHNALLCGIREASCDVIVTMDDDLQNPPEEIPQLLGALTESCDVVYGSPAGEKQVFWRRLGSRLIRLALRIALRDPVAFQVSSFRAFRTEIREAFAAYQSPFVSIDVLLSWGTTSFSSVGVRHAPRESGKSNYSFWKLFAHAVDLLTGFSVVPLQLASLVGFFFTLFGVAVLVYVIGRYFITGGSVPGFPFLASVIAIFSGSQLFALGIIGEYLARIHRRTMDRPVYIVRSAAGREGKERPHVSIQN
jgi:glycosyltransferase involved in cell wall biosynthesis